MSAGYTMAKKATTCDIWVCLKKQSTTKIRVIIIFSVSFGFLFWVSSIFRAWPIELENPAPPIGRKKFIGKKSRSGGTLLFKELPFWLFEVALRPAETGRNLAEEGRSGPRAKSGDPHPHLSSACRADRGGERDQNGGGAIGAGGGRVRSR